VDPKSTIVFVMNHRSNMDYVLVAFLAAERTALSYAVGEWARVWPLQQLIRAMGAFFVRRRSGDPLYRVVLSRYVHMATEAGVTQAVFPEGGLTLDGRLRPPRFGLLDYMLKGFDERSGRDLVFVPVGINYDRVLEDRAQLQKLHPERPRPGRARTAAVAARFALEHMGLWLTGRWHRLGYACVNFGSPISMREHALSRGLHFPALGEAARHAEVAAVGEALMAAIGRVIPVLPVSLVASLLVTAPARRWSELELKAAACARMAALEARGAHLYLPRQDQDYAFGVGLRMLTLRHLVEEADGLFAPVPENLDALAYYANAIAHLAEGAAGAAHPRGSPGA
jgi:glycerol-3-phosphate O-acyltransferase